MACDTPDIRSYKTIPEQKKFLRNRARTFLAEFSSDKELMKQCSVSASDALVKSDIFTNAPYVLGFMSMKEEIDLFPVMEKALSLGKKILFPRMKCSSNFCEKSSTLPENNLMDFYFVENLKDSFSSDNKYSILEPKTSCEKLEVSLLPEKSLILVPGLAFNLEGDRLGRGKGFYDRFIETLGDKKVVLCGVTPTICVTKRIPVEENDRKVDYLLTEYGLVKTVK